MAITFASGRHAFGFCDVCAFRFDLAELKPQIVMARPTGLFVCDECNDEDQPQLFLGKTPVVDPQALRNPRPDTTEDESRVLWGWNPVGNTAVFAVATLGTVTVETNR